MNNSMISASVSMNALQQKLDMMANNIANVDTVGYKKKEASFQDVLTNISSQPRSFPKEGRLTPLGISQGYGTMLGAITMNMSQGAIKESGNPMDLSLEGEGLMQVGANQWTRDGSLALSINPQAPGTSLLTTKDGKPIIGVDEQPVSVPNNTRIVIQPDGVIMSYDNAKPGVAPVRAGQIKLVRVVHPQLLQQSGDNLFELQPGAAYNDALRTEVFNPRNPNPITVRQGFLEQSNVDVAQEMTEMMNVQRAFQLNSRAIRSSDTMMGLANNLRG